MRSSNRGRCRTSSGSPPLTVVDAQQRRVLLVATGQTRQPGDVVALAQAVLAGLLHRHVDVVAARQVAVDAEEAVPLVAEVEVAGHLDRLAGWRRRQPGAARASLLAAIAAVDRGRRPAAPSSGPPPLRRPPAPAPPAARTLAVAIAAVPVRLRARPGGRGEVAPGRRQPRPARRGDGAARLRSAIVVGSVVLVLAPELELPVGQWLGGRSDRDRRCRRPSPPRAAHRWSPRCRRRPPATVPAAAAVGAAGLFQDAVDDVALLGPRERLQPERRRDGDQLVTVLALEDRAFEGLRAHGAPAFVVLGVDGRTPTRARDHSPGRRRGETHPSLPAASKVGWTARSPSGTENHKRLGGRSPVRLPARGSERGAL